MKCLARYVSILCFIPACSSSDPGNASGQTGTTTYFEHVAPIFEQNCLQCHQANGIAPFRLDDYATAKTHAASIQQSVQTRSMPPWHVTADGSCGNFEHSLALSPSQIETITNWVKAGAPAGTPRAIQIPSLPTLTEATDYLTPLFTPKIQGGQLAEFDEYRCFSIPAPVERVQFITGYEVVPGTPEIVHHVIGNIVDMGAPSDIADKTNEQVINELRAKSPEREGWSCFGMAGEGVRVKSAPVTWAPGQGVVDYPEKTGVKLSPTDHLVIQVHYNLADATNHGKSDQSKLRLRLVDQVENEARFVLFDPLLGSLRDKSKPATQLAPGQASVLYSWSATLRDFGINQPGAWLHGIMPHMHQRGHKYRFVIDNVGNKQCAADVQHWDFEWQRLYFYKSPYQLSQDSKLQVTCDFDTSNEASPVLPGWGTRNEMCLAVFYFTLPAANAAL